MCTASVSLFKYTYEQIVLTRGTLELTFDGYFLNFDNYYINLYYGLTISPDCLIFHVLPTSILLLICTVRTTRETNSDSSNYIIILSKIIVFFWHSFVEALVLQSSNDSPFLHTLYAHFMKNAGLQNVIHFHSHWADTYRWSFIQSWSVMIRSWPCSMLKQRLRQCKIVFVDSPERRCLQQYDLGQVR